MGFFTWGPPKRDPAQSVEKTVSTSSLHYAKQNGQKTVRVRVWG